MGKPRNTDIDFENDADSIDIDQETLSKLTAECRHLIELQAKRAIVKEELDKLDESIRLVETESIPLIMDSIGVEKIQLLGGKEVSVKRVIKASITEKNRVAAIAWLRKNGFGAIVKNDVVASFTKGEDIKASKLEHFLSDNKIVFDRKETVNHNTLSAFVREQLEGGKKIPTDILGVFEVRIAQIKNK